jgi:general secretion pathway protein D
VLTFIFMSREKRGAFHLHASDPLHVTLYVKLRRAAVVLSLLTFAQPAISSEASDLAKRARKAEKAKRPTDAYLLYSQASVLEPGNRRYRARAESLRTPAILTAKSLPLDTDSADDADLDAEPEPAQYFDSPSARDLAAIGIPQSPPELHPSPGRFDLNLDGDFKALFQKVAALYNLDCVFDSDYEAGRRIVFHLEQADYRDALDGLAAATGSFVVPVSAKIFLVAKDTTQKRTDLEQSMTITVPVPQSLTSQELVELAQAVRQAIGVEKLAWDNKSNSIIMRDRISRVVPAQALFQSLLAYRPQTMIELRLIEIRHSDALNYGINLPNMFNIAFTGQSTTGGTTTVGGLLPSSTVNSFPFNSRTFSFISIASQGGNVAQAMLRGLIPTSLSLWSISIPEATALINFSNTVGRNILTTDIRSIDGQPATLHVGQRYPILTGSYSAGTSVGAQFAPAPSFTFEDLGITMKVTPHVHGMEGISLDVESEFKLLSGAVVNGNPIISNRKLKSTVNLTGGEWAVVAGLTQDSDSHVSNGTLGLSQIPWIGNLFRQHTKQKDKSEVLVLMRPRLLSLPGNQTVTKAVWVGTETRPHTPI